MIDGTSGFTTVGLELALALVGVDIIVVVAVVAVRGGEGELIPIFIPPPKMLSPEPLCRLKLARRTTPVDTSRTFSNFRLILPPRPNTLPSLRLLTNFASFSLMPPYLPELALPP